MKSSIEKKASVTSTGPHLYQPSLPYCFQDQNQPRLISLLLACGAPAYILCYTGPGMTTRDKLWESGHDESVEVNQRALIDKVLARYSGEFTVFRELLQNSDDAQSKTVEIRFQTQDYRDGKTLELAGGGNALPDLKTTPASLVPLPLKARRSFIGGRDEDWTRLKKIAEGNPDEQKIGAFGVGFYSLFSVTEEPFVKSGNQWMGFYWKDRKDQLYARRGQLEDDNQSSWTSFEMDLREPTPIPPAFDFTRFLASSITFMTYLEEVAVYFDDWCLVKLKKAVGHPQVHQLPRDLSAVTIHATVMNWVYTSGTESRKHPLPKVMKATATGFFSSLSGFLTGVSTPQRQTTPLPPITPQADPLETSTTSIILSVFSADVTVRLNSKLSSELYRSTKKNPPSNMKYELIYTTKDKYDASRQEDLRQQHAVGSIFQGLRADLDGTGTARIFIGHATAQTTGIGGHMAARFIPTVEREAIDFMDRNVAVWNRELLYVGGILARAAYQYEIDSIRESWETNAEVFRQASQELPEELRSSLTEKAIHVLKFFTYHHSTPSAEVSALLENAFFKCNLTNTFPLISTLGIRPASQIRLPDPSFAFLKQLPLVPAEFASEPMVLSLQSKGMIKSISFDDVLKELKSRPLPEEDMVACMRWWISLYDPKDAVRLTSVRTQLLDAAVLMVSTSNGDRIIPLHSIQTILNQRSLNGLPSEGPLPSHLLPASITKNFSSDDLKRAFSWADLTIYDWLSHICDPSVVRENPAYDIETSPQWSEKVLSFVARNWGHNLSTTLKQQIISLLKAKACIPTSDGMKLPSESYFPNVDIFHDLPIVKLPSGSPVKGHTEKLLQELDVRSHVELQMIFNRMIKTNEWTINDLTRYLVSVKANLKEEEIRRLKLTAAFPKEKQAAEHDSQSKPRRLRADQLYEPLPVLRQLGLPLIDWGTHTKWRSNSEEAQFLFELGLRRYPPLEELIQLCAGSDLTIRTTALKYLVDNLRSKYTDYDCNNYRDIPFIPALDGGESRLGTPRQVFSKPEWSQLGFLVVHPSIQADVVKLQIKEHPTTTQLVELLQSSRPKDPEVGKVWFSILSVRVSDFSRSDLSKLAETSFVPVPTPSEKAGPTMRWLPPTQCYLGQRSKEKFHSKLFVFVDFGAAGNAFLNSCGARQEPSVEELAKILLENPRGFYELAQGPENFLNEIRNIAVNRNNLSAITMARMKRAPILLCCQRKVVDQSTRKAGDEFDDEEWDVGYDLKIAEQIVISDDTNAHQVFGVDLFTAPQEDIIEAFYMELGSRRLSSLVKEEYLLGVEVRNSKRASTTRSLILERLPIFLHEHNHARMKISLDWLQVEANFQVKAYGQIKVKKTLSYGKLHLERKQEASAVAKRGVSKRIELMLADNAEIDMYEVAMCLNRSIFDSPKPHDALLFMTILSTDLRALKRRGYNVDRILRQRRLEKQAEEARLREEDIKLLSPAPQPTEEKPALTSSSSSTLTSGSNAGERASSLSNTFQKLKQRIGNKGGILPSGQMPGFSRGAERSQANEPEHQDPQFPGGLPGPPSPQRPYGANNPTVTPLDNIASNIAMAMRACRPESKNLLQNRQEMRHVKEVDNDGYCDVSGHAQNMKSVGTMGQVKIYVAQDVPERDAQNILTVKSSSIARFIHVMTSLASIYELSLANLHIFYDTSGGLIAFNRDGSIFLNLRYYEAWHDTEVGQGTMANALISWVSAKPSDPDEEDVSIPSVSSIAAVAANEVKRSSPRKRRVGAGNGKRRRKEVEDGDATYPAKRTRQTRGVGGEEIEFDEVHGQVEADGTPEVDGPAERRPERRSTRSRAKRRDSSEIESVDDQPIQDSLSVSEENVKQPTLEGISEGANEEKEEGEISGDQ
ncbi:hypothetical protein D9756_007388 [Leucocoprinus leucothites]|uniref:Sacsin/Nov domain-containing protein n=1 Tax=Leucocoprinus leucothites TaxID=201217 RepID=A0A8H5D3E3_9AGAR|nr:hypothetical protein D9756_007388 [Leucoagaricus leucothites]